jgi:hypothetical protein
MASPHTAGAVALLWSCNPSLIGQMANTFDALQNTADSAPAGNCGAPPDGEGNYTFGYGYLNILAAGQAHCSTGATPTPTNSPSPTATSGPSPTPTATRTPLPPVTPIDWKYLPIIPVGYDQVLPTPTPTQTPEVTNTPSPSPSTTPGAGGIGNGDFEQGPVVWTEYSENGWDLIIDSGFPGSVTPRSGSWAVWEGGDYDEIAYIEQQVSIQVGTPYLVYWHWIASQDACGFDFAYVRINGTTVDQYELCTSNNTGGWVSHSVDLSAYAGQSVSLQIRTETDSSLNSNLFIDDVSLAASPAAGQGQQLYPDEAAAAPR